MHFYLDKLLKFIFRTNLPDAEIISEPKFNEFNIPYYTVRMRGCRTPVDINAEEIIDKFTNKFSQSDIKKATKIFVKYKSTHTLISIENNYAVLQNRIENSYQLIDLSDMSFLRDIELDTLKSEDIFKLGVYFEKIRLEKERKLFNLVKSENNIIKLKLVKTND